MRGSLHFGKCILPITAILMAAGAAMAAPPRMGAAPGANRLAPGKESAEGANLLWQIGMDARQVRTHAWRWEMLTKTRGITWYDYEEQWNTIATPAADMSAKLARLENLRAGLPAWEQNAIDASKPLVTDITRGTSYLRDVLNKSYINLHDSTMLSSQPLTGEVTTLARDADRLVQATKARD